jgi:ADP-ribose pyrophosphatase
MPAKTNHRITLHQGRVFRLERENVTLENGVTVDLDLIRHPGAAAVLPFEDDETLILIRQYRHAIQAHIWELPAGTLEPGESPLACARRELTEETGFSATVWEAWGEMTPLPAYSDERITLFSARGLMPARQQLDQDEILKVHRVRIQDAFRMVDEGGIRDGKTITALFLLQCRRLQEGRGASEAI